MIASGSKKGNSTMGLIGDKQVLNKEQRAPEGKEGGGAHQTDSRIKRREMMMAATWIAMAALIECLKAFA